MGSPFDSIQAAAHSVVSNTMGCAASWTPAAGGPSQTAVVLFNKPTQKAQITDDQYEAIHWKFEYLAGDFSGLFESVRANNTEIVVIDGESFAAYKAERKYDGKTIVVHVEPSE